MTNLKGVQIASPVVIPHEFCTRQHNFLNRMKSNIISNMNQFELTYVAITISIQHPGITNDYTYMPLTIAFRYVV